MVVVPEPAVKCLRPFLARAVDGTVGPAGEQRADEALRLAVRLRTVGPGTQVADSQPATGECVQRRHVRRAVVGQQPLDPEPIARVEGSRPAQEADRRRRLLVWQHLGVGESRVVVGMPPLRWTAVVKRLPSLSFSRSGPATGSRAGSGAYSRCRMSPLERTARGGTERGRVWGG